MYIAIHISIKKKKESRRFSFLGKEKFIFSKSKKENFCNNILDQFYRKNLTYEIVSDLWIWTILIASMIEIREIRSGRKVRGISRKHIDGEKGGVQNRDFVDHGPEHEDSRGQVFPHASSRYVVLWNAGLRNYTAVPRAGTSLFDFWILNTITCIDHISSKYDSTSSNNRW